MKNNTQTVLTDFGEIFIALKADFIALVPNLINALIVLILGIFLAYLFKWFSEKLVRWCTKLLPNSITDKKLVKEILPFLILGTGRVLFFLTLFLSISMSLRKMGMGIISEWLQNLSKYLPNIFGALLVVILGWKAKDLIEAAIDRALNKASIQHSQFISKVISWSIFIISALVSLQQVGLDISLIITLGTVLLGVLSLAIALMFALGAKDSISDILYCYQIGKVLKVGSAIEIENFQGKVKAIGPVFVLLETENGNITVPGKVFSREITSFSQVRGTS